MPLNTLALIDTLAVLLAQAAQLARVRLASAASPVLRLMMERDHATGEVELLRRELAVLRSHRATMKPHHRPDYGPEQRLEILQIMRLRDWSMVEVAERFVLHVNTVRAWIRALNGDGKSARLFVTPAWNRFHDAVRWATQELRRMFPEPEFGTRTLAVHLVRAGIQVSRSSVQRILREPERRRPAPKPALIPPAGAHSDHLLKPRSINRVWHLDLTTIHILWFRFTVAALMDGFSRKLLALRVYRGAPNSRDMGRLMNRAATVHGKPRFLITDHGCQFQRWFKKTMEALGISHVRGRVRCPAMSGKIERFFRILRVWLRVVLLPIDLHSMQRRLDAFRGWYNICRPSSALGGRTPEEAWDGAELPASIPIYARDPVEVEIGIQRRRCRGDPRLPIAHVSLRLQAKRAA